MPTTMTISLPDEMKTFIEERLKSGSFSSASEFIRQLLREEQKRAESERLERMLIEGATSGESIRADDKYWQQLHKRVEQKVRRNSRSGARK